MCPPFSPAVYPAVYSRLKTGERIDPIVFVIARPRRIWRRGQPQRRTGIVTGISQFYGRSVPSGSSCCARLFPLAAKIAVLSDRTIPMLKAHLNGVRGGAYHRADDRGRDRAYRNRNRSPHLRPSRARKQRAACTDDPFFHVRREQNRSSAARHRIFRAIYLHPRVSEAGVPHKLWKQHQRQLPPSRSFM